MTAEAMYEAIMIFTNGVGMIAIVFGISLLAMGVYQHIKFSRLQERADAEPTHDENLKPLPPHGRIKTFYGVFYRIPRNWKG